MRVNNKVALLLLLCCYCSSGNLARQPTCHELQENLAKNGTCVNMPSPCMDFCSGKPIVGEENCSETTAPHCCYQNNSCILKQPQDGQDFENPFNKNMIGEKLFDQYTDGARSVSIGGGLNPILTLFPNLPICLRFPDNCQINYKSPSDLEPPVNIPYCQRIACRPDNPFLEADPTQCLITPGCAFDFNLAFYRSIFNQAVLPAVPVCHLAIRNEVFLRNATAFVQQSKTPWNPLLANCLIEELKNEIFTETNGCAKLKILRELGYPTKLAGWKSISSRDCRLINGCWLENTCYYSVSENSTRTLSDQDKPHFDNFPVGRPECLPIESNLTSGEFLDGYHNCLRAGCNADVDPNDLTLNLLLAGTTALPPHLQHRYFTLVLSGQARADNYKRVIDQLMVFDAFSTALSQSNSSFSSLFHPDARELSVTSEKSDSSESNLPSGETNLESLKETTIGQAAIEEKALVNVARLIEISNSQSEAISRSFSLCPYQPILWPGFPPLLGSFDGCCETPFCYLPRSLIRNSHSEIATYTTAWSSWSACSVTCGKGFQTRRKSCVGELCRKEDTDSRPCNPGACPIKLYSPWSEYGECSVTCGGGTKIRKRECIVENCLKHLHEAASCNTENCPIILYSPWSEYGKCNVTCGGGAKIRRRECLIGDCLESLLEAMPCNTKKCPINVYSSWSEYGQCDASCDGGVKIRHRRCINGGCTDNLRQVIYCNTGRCPEVRAGQWSRCSRTCGVGIQRRNLNCIKPGDYGCPKKWYEQRRCETFCGHYRYLESRCNQRTCKITRTLQCVQGNGRPGRCRQERMQPTTLSRNCYEGRCRCFYSPNHSFCPQNRPRTRG